MERTLKRHAASGLDASLAVCFASLPALAQSANVGMRVHWADLVGGAVWSFAHHQSITNHCVPAVASLSDQS